MYNRIKTFKPIETIELQKYDFYTVKQSLSTKLDTIHAKELENLDDSITFEIDNNIISINNDMIITFVSEENIFEPEKYVDFVEKSINDIDNIQNIKFKDYYEESIPLKINEIDSLVIHIKTMIDKMDIDKLDIDKLDLDKLDIDKLVYKIMIDKLDIDKLVYKMIIDKLDIDKLDIDKLVYKMIIDKLDIDKLDIDKLVFKTRQLLANRYFNQLHNKDEEKIGAY